MREKIEELFPAREPERTRSNRLKRKKGDKDCEDSLAVMMYDLGCETTRQE